MKWKRDNELESNLISFFLMIAVFLVYTTAKSDIFDNYIAEYQKNYDLIDQIAFENGGYADKTPLNEKDVAFFDDITAAPISDSETDKLKDFDYLKSNFYIIDGRTSLLPSDVPVEEFLQKDLTIKREGKKPKVLIFHTHSTEGFADSDMSKGMEEGVWGVGERLAQILRDDYGLEVLHDTGRYDVVNGKSSIRGAYEREEPHIRRILRDNPSIELVIDLHRDGVAENVRLVTEIDGKTCAKVMFFNGLCRVYKDGELSPASGLSNPYLKDNLALSFKAQLASRALYPDFSRKIYINAYRYSLHMAAKSMLIEVGGQTNTKEEALNAMQPLAKVIASVVLKNE